MSASDKFLLSQPDHQISLAGYIKVETKFQDVTLACDGHQLQAHQVMLAAASPLLMNLLRDNPKSHPLIHLSGVSFSLMENIVKFIYSGEVFVGRDQVDSFLAVARGLQLKGLRFITTGRGRRTEDPEPGARHLNLLTKTAEASQLAREKINKMDCSSGLEIKVSSSSNIISIRIPGFTEGSGKTGEEFRQKSILQLSEAQSIKQEELEISDVNHDMSKKSSGGKHQCPDCSKAFSQSYVLTRHIKAVHLGEQHQCAQCGNVFGHSSALTRHIKDVHLGKKSFQCPHCDKAFAQSCNLTSHIKSVHLREKNYQCRHCGKAFGQSTNLATHIKTVHLREKNYQCDDCGKAFGLSTNLTSHIKTVHLKEKNYQCPYCGKAYGQSGYLGQHIKSKH